MGRLLCDVSKAYTSPAAHFGRNKVDPASGTGQNTDIPIWVC
jgi:hypothetical protein